MKLYFSALVLAFSFLNIAQADDHGVSELVGTQIQMMSSDHAFAGTVKGRVVLGNVNEENGTSQLFIKNNGQLTSAVFQKNDQYFGGNVGELSIRFYGIDRDTNSIYILVNGGKATVTIQADAFENNHFIHPKYLVTMPNGEKFEYHLKTGKACYNFSTHMAMLMLAAYNY